MSTGNIVFYRQAKPFPKRNFDSQLSENLSLCLPVTEGHRVAPFSFTIEELNQRLYKREGVKVVRALSETKRIKTKDDHDSSLGYNQCQKSGPEKPQFGQPSYAIQSFPDAVQLCHSGIPGEGYGVCAKQNIPVGTWIGPYEGKRVRLEECISETDTSYMWEIFQNGRLLYYLDAIDENTSSWMRFIRCARCKEEQNMYCFQYCGNVYYRAFREIPVGTELLVWYDESYPLYLGIPLGIHDLHKNGNKTVSAPLQASYQAPAHNASRHPVVTLSSSSDIVKHNGNSGVFRESSRSQGPTGRELQCKTSHPPILHSSPRGSRPPNKSSHLSSPQFFKAAPTPSQTSLQGDTEFVAPSSGPSTGSEIPALSRVDSSRTQHTSAEIASMAGGRWSQVSDASSSLKNKHLTGYPEWSQQGNQERLDFEDGVWKCGQCDKTFLQRAMLQMHVCARMPNKPYQCGHCCQSFNHPNELRTHAVVHSGKKPFKCGYCARTFAGATTLNNHVRTHTGERPFTCDKCNKTFSQATQLSRHRKCLYECTGN